MLIRRAGDLKSSEITDKKLWLSRRQLIKGALAGGTTLATAALSHRLLAPGTPGGRERPLGPLLRSALSTGERATPYEQVTGYNNFYEFGTDKYAPAKYAGGFRIRPWQVAIEGAVKKPGVLDLDRIRRLAPLEERIYRLRCVEGWSMVIPWVGFPLSELIRHVEPAPHARFVQLVTYKDQRVMPGQRRQVLPWPYVEGLRMDEAMHPLALLCFGLYGEELPPQNGGPLRLMVPWKYGFKSIKSIVRIRFGTEQPVTTWSETAPGEYGFYANVNPEVHHPRWSQALERRLGEYGKRRTLLFNGYADQVAHLYAGMDLRKSF